MSLLGWSYQKCFLLNFFISKNTTMKIVLKDILWKINQTTLTKTPGKSGVCVYCVCWAELLVY